jgi:uroporphyrin-3 C-methyltransferase
MNTDTQEPTSSENLTHSTAKKRRSWVSWVALFAIIIAVTCWFQLVHQQKKSTNNYSQLQSSFHRTLSDTAQLGETINSLQNQINSQNEHILALQAAFNRSQAENSGYETDLTLQQVERFLVQANLNLNFNQDIPGAISLLQAADQRLNNLSEPKVIPLRQAIALDIVKLQAATPVDTVGILSKLAALRDEAATLPLFAINSKLQIFHKAKIESMSNPRLAAVHSTWEKTWQLTLETLKSLVIIRDRRDEISPLISIEQEQFLRQNLQLQFQQTQWAVLQRQQAVYQFSLTQANEWIQRYFADNDQATQAIQADINQLQKIKLTPETPNMSQLIEQLHTLQLQFNKSRTLAIAETPPVKTATKEAENITPMSTVPATSEATPAAKPNHEVAAVEKGELV